MPHFIQFASFTGLWGVTLWVLLVNGLVHLYLATSWGRAKLLVLAGLAALVVGPYAHGRHVLLHREPRPAVEVGIVQPNVGNNKWRLGVRDSIIASLLDQTASFAAGLEDDPPELIVWPETAVPARLKHDPVWTERITALVDSIGIPVLAGFPDGERRPDGTIRFTNSAGLLLPGRGVAVQYDKQHLVPFSEYFPLPLLDRVDFGQSSFSPGTLPGLVAATRVPFGVLICFESIFPGPTRELARQGARYVVNITNDQWFGDSAAPAQHFNMNVLRCIENRMGMARAANTGISGAIDPHGLVVARTQTFVQDELVVAVELGGEPTLYTRLGDWILVPAALVVAGYGALAWRRRDRT
jgi:apolipoprotein N-acyltransferase